MDYQALSDPHVRRVREHLRILDEANPRLDAATDAEREDRAGSLRQVLSCERIVRAVGEPRVIDPPNSRMFFQEPRDGEAVCAVPLHPQRKRLEALKEKERVEGAERRP